MVGGGGGGGGRGWGGERMSPSWYTIMSSLGRFLIRSWSCYGVSGAPTRSCASTATKFPLLLIGVRS